MYTFVLPLLLIATSFCASAMDYDSQSFGQVDFSPIQKFGQVIVSSPSSTPTDSPARTAPTPTTSPEAMDLQNTVNLQTLIHNAKKIIASLESGEKPNKTRCS